MDPSSMSSRSSLPLVVSLSSHLRELAFVRRHAIFGRHPRSVFAHLSRPAGPASTVKSSASAGVGGAVNGYESGKVGDFLYYSDSDDDDLVGVGSASGQPGADRLSCNFVDCLLAREHGLGNVGSGRFFPQRMSTEYGTRHMLANAMLKESTLSLPNVDKIFCSKWLSHRQVVFGTKCNKLMVFDVNTHHLDQIPSLPSSENSTPPEFECGIHAIEINPSRTLLATAGKSPNDMAVYRLPTLDPICVGEFAHRDWIFDMTWLDDQFVVTGSRDGTLGLWRITDDTVNDVIKAETPTFQYIKPMIVKVCKTTDRVRAMCFNQRRTELAVISSNGYIHCWDGLKFKQIMSKKLPHVHEAVCLAVDDDSLMYAVGSKANTDLLDARTLQAIKKIPSRNNGSNIRSVSFKGNILTIGNGNGNLIFWDLRAGKFLESTMNSNRAVSLKTSRGWVNRDDNMVINMEVWQHNKYAPAIYTHCYDTSGTRLFAAGGPLQSGLKGNYVALFQ